MTNLWSLITGPLDVIFGSVRDYFQTRNKVKEAELESRLAVLAAKTNATVAIFNQGLAGDIAWENTSRNDSGWKDEFWTIVIASPLILSWIPFTQPWVANGFQSFNAMPDWYQIAVGISISAAFGFRKFADIMALKNGVDISRVAELRKFTELIPTNDNKKDT